MARQPQNGDPLGFENTLWKAADKLRGSMDSSEYKHVVLGLVFLKYVDDAFGERRAQLAADLEADGITGDQAEELLESRDETRLKGSFGCRPRLAGNTSKPVPSNPRSEKSLTLPWMQ